MWVELRWIFTLRKYKEVTNSAVLIAVQLHYFQHYIKIGAPGSSSTTRAMRGLDYCWKIHKVTALLGLRAKQAGFIPTQSSSQNTCSSSFPLNIIASRLRTYALAMNKPGFESKLYDLDKLLNIFKAQFPYL